MSMPKIPDFNPDININREDAINLIIASIAMEELSLAHILNAEGEKIQYFLGTLNGRNPGEVTICDIMEVNKSVQKTLKNATKAEMFLQFKLEDVIELENKKSTTCRKPISGYLEWIDNNNLYKTRPENVVIKLLRDGVFYRNVTVDETDDWCFTFPCLPICKNSNEKFKYTIEEPVIEDYETIIDGYNVRNTLKEVTITGTKTWVDTGKEGDRPTNITVKLLQNGNQFKEAQVASPAAPQSTAEFNFKNVPVFDNNGKPFVYTLDEIVIPKYVKSIDGFNIKNTHE